MVQLLRCGDDDVCPTNFQRLDEAVVIRAVATTTALSAAGQISQDEAPAALDISDREEAAATRAGIARFSCWMIHPHVVLAAIAVESPGAEN